MGLCVCLNVVPPEQDKFSGTHTDTRSLLNNVLPPTTANGPAWTLFRAAGGPDAIQ